MCVKYTLLAMQGDGKLQSLKSLQAERQRLVDEQQRFYDERAKLKKEANRINTIKSNVDSYLRPTASKDRESRQSSEIE